MRFFLKMRRGRTVRAGIRPVMAVVLSLVILVGLVGCQGSKEQIRIGLIVTQSGENAALGQQMINAAEMAAKEINNAGGLQVADRQVEVVLVIRDDEGNSETAAGVAQELIAQETVAALVGPLLDRSALAAAVVAENARVPMISPTSTDSLTTAGRQYVFRATYTNEFQGEVMARFAIEDLGAAADARGAAVIYDVADDYNRGIAERFKQVMEDAGVRVSVYETYTTGETDFSSQLEEVAGGVNVIVLPNYPSDVALQVEQARAMGVFQTIICSDALSGINPADYPALDRIFLTAPWHPAIQGDVSQKFTEAYRAAYNQEPNSVAALTYDSMQLLFQAIRSQGSWEPQAIRNGLVGLGRYEGVTGVIEYQNSGDPVKSVAILQIKDGKYYFFKLVSP